MPRINSDMSYFKSLRKTTIPNKPDKRVSSLLWYMKSKLVALERDRANPQITVLPWYSLPSEFVETQKEGDLINTQ